MLLLRRRSSSFIVQQERLAAAVFDRSCQAGCSRNRETHRHLGTSDCFSRALPRLSRALPRFSHALPRFSRALPRLLRALPRFLRALPRFVRALPRLLCALPRCLRALPHFVRTLPRFSRVLRDHGVLVFRFQECWQTVRGSQASRSFTFATPLSPPRVSAAGVSTSASSEATGC